ncbi:MAG: hypothetical protein JOZ75_04790 [Candidatus Dormibacteraeota bacterium]|nr:hypothetical protein [Candidatus Dormibacteraeota bacterium]
MTRRASLCIAALGALAALLAACGDTQSAPRLTGDPVHYLLTLSQMTSPDFTVEIPATSQPAAGFASGDPAAQNQLAQAGLTNAASVTFIRQVDFPTSNGPIEVVDSVAAFTGADGAHTWFTNDSKRLDQEQGAEGTSTGALGDEAHATTQVATAPDGVQAVQVTIEWRVANVVALLHVRGRYGGTRLEDALTLAHKQTSTHLILPPS